MKCLAVEIVTDLCSIIPPDWNMEEFVLALS